MNHRRKLIITLGTGALAAPFGAFAQPAKPSEKIWRVGFLRTVRRPDSLDTDAMGGFAQGMRERGYIEGKNLIIEWRFAEGDRARLPGLAAELVQLKVDVIIASSPPAIRAVQQATTTIPVVMTVPGNPIAEGFVASLARPGGNITGAVVTAGEIIAKRLQLLLEISPKLTRVAFLMNPANRNHVGGLAITQAAAQKTKVSLLPVEVRAAKEIDAAFAIMKRDKAGGVILTPDTVFNDQMGRIAELALQQRLPLITGIREYVDAGCLMSYGASFRDNYRRAAYYVDRIFKGAKPADLPVEQPLRFELFINGKTAKTLGLKILQSLLIMAEQVIE